MLSKFSDNLGCSTEKEKDKLQNMYIIEGKMQADCQEAFSKVFSTFSKVFLAICRLMVYNNSIET